MDLTSGTVYRAKKAHFDAIYRVKEMNGSGGTFTIRQISETKTFFQNFLYPIFENPVLSNAIRNIWKAYEYNQEYISFLLKMQTKDDFLSKAKEYSTPFKTMPPKELCFNVSILLKTIGFPLTSAELSLLLNVKPQDIEQIASMLIEYDSNKEKIE